MYKGASNRRGSSQNRGQHVLRETLRLALFVLSVLLLQMGSACTSLSPHSLSVTQADQSSSDAGVVAAIDPSSLVGQVTSCPDRFAHPVACCSGGRGQAVGCTKHPSDPFRACEHPTFAFPDPTKCCSLDIKQPGCVDVTTGGSTQDGSTIGPCVFPCGPGAYPASATDPYPTCAADPTSLACIYCCSGSGEKAGCVTTLFSGSNASPGQATCRACPEGWSGPARGQPDVCCRPKPDTQELECFSQASYVLNVGT